MRFNDRVASWWRWAFRGRKKRRQDKIARLQLDLKWLSLDRDALTLEVKNAVAYIDELKSEIGRLKIEINELNERLRLWDEEEGKLAKRHAADIRALETEIEKRDAQIAVLNVQIEGQAKTIVMQQAWVDMSKAQATARAAAADRVFGGQYAPVVGLQPGD